MSGALRIRTKQHAGSGVQCRNGASMKLLQILICCYLCFIVTFYAQAAFSHTHSRESAGDTQSPAQLRLTTNIVEQRYCSRTRLSLTLRLTFTNIGHEPVILDKKSSVIGKHMVSRNLKDAATKKYEYEVSTFYTRRGTGLRLDPPAQSLFVILKPGESYDLETNLGLSLYDGTKDSKNDLRAGEHVLQVKVWTWYYPFPAESFREKWREKGFLWSKDITSLPMPLRVDKNKVISNCSPDA
jgi:hypothetical protein